MVAEAAGAAVDMAEAVVVADAEDAAVVVMAGEAAAIDNSNR
jgi:hypothetical protein